VNAHWLRLVGPYEAAIYSYINDGLALLHEVPRMSKKSTQRGLDGRHRDKDGEIHRKRGDTLVSTLRKTYGDDFAAGVRGDTKLKDLKGYGSLRGEFVIRRGIDISKPIFEQANKSAKKGAHR
jgi:hypothetical protein